MKIEIHETEQVCGNCIHFIQHYVKSSANYYGFSACNSGCCRYPRLKERKPGEKGCQNFECRNEIKNQAV